MTVSIFIVLWLLRLSGLLSGVQSGCNNIRIATLVACGCHWGGLYICPSTRSQPRSVPSKSDAPELRHQETLPLCLRNPLDRWCGKVKASCNAAQADQSTGRRGRQKCRNKHTDYYTTCFRSRTRQTPTRINTAAGHGVLLWRGRFSGLQQGPRILPEDLHRGCGWPQQGVLALAWGGRGEG